MKSKITISYDYEQNVPFIKIQYETSEDERDRMVHAFINSMGGDVCFTKFGYETSHLLGVSIAAIRPIPFINLKEEIKTMNVWIDHVEDNVLDEKTYQYVNDNCQAFHNWLSENGIAFIEAGHDTGVSKSVNLFNLGVNWGEYKCKNKPQ